MNRRDFLSSLVTVSGGALIDSSALDKVEAFSYKSGFSILQGFTDETTTQFTVDVPKFLKLHYEILDPSTGRRFYPKKQTSVSRDFSFYRVDKIIFDGLYLASGFQLIVKDSNNKILDTRQFNTLDTSPRAARIAMLSCMFDMNPIQHEMWRMVYKTKPDLIMFMGDNVYADLLALIDGPELMWYRYIISRRTIPFYHQPVLIPTIATWDDHDFGKNNSNGKYDHKENSTNVFRAFYAQTPMNNKFQSGPGISCSVEAFGRKFVMLDGRTYRRLKTSKYNKGFLGDEQMSWFRNQVENYDAPVMVITGSQFFGGYSKTSESFESTSPEEFSEFLSVLASRSQPCLFGSGDVHFSEVMKIEKDFMGFSPYEITSSCLHSFPKLNPPKNHRRVYGAKYENFVIVDFAAADNRHLVQGLGRGHKKLFKLNVDIEG